MAVQQGVSVERSQILKALGAELLQVTDVPGFAEMLKTGLSLHGLEEVMENVAKSKGWFYINQCSNPANSRAHIIGTGPERWEDTNGKVDYVVQLVGTGGTLSGWFCNYDNICWYGNECYCYRLLSQIGSNQQR